MPGHTKCCTCHAKSFQQTWRSEAPKWNPSEEISALTSWHLWWTCLLCAGHAKCIFADPLQMSHACQCFFWNCYKTLTFCSLLARCTIPCAYHAKRHLNVQKCSVPFSFLHFWLRNVLRATTACTFSTSQLPKVVRRWGVLYILTSKCASHHNGVHFFDISTSKSGPELRWFLHFDFEMCFTPQRRALFRHLSFQKWSENGVFCTFWLRNVLRATTACNFSSLVWPAGSAPAALASLLFDPPEPQIIGKTWKNPPQCFATFLPFRASASSFFWLFLFSDLLSSNLSLLSASALLCFSSVHIVGSLTSKLPSTTAHNCTKLCNFMKIKQNKQIRLALGHLHPVTFWGNNVQTVLWRLFVVPDRSAGWYRATRVTRAGVCTLNQLATTRTPLVCRAAAQIQ